MDENALHLLVAQRVVEYLDCLDMSPKVVVNAVVQAAEPVGAREHDGIVDIQACRRVARPRTQDGVRCCLRVQDGILQNGHASGVVPARNLAIF